MVREVISDEELEREDRIHSNFYNYLNDSLVILNYAFEIFCILLNCVHLAILLRKPLRTNAVYIIMIGIAIFEIIYFIQVSFNRFYVIDFEILYGTCLRWPLHGVEPTEAAWNLVENICRRMFVWLMVQLALIRTLSISFPMSDWLTKPVTTIVCSLVIFLFWLLLHDWPLLFGRLYWQPDNLRFRDCLFNDDGSADKKYIFAVPYQYGPPYTKFLDDAEGIIRIITLTVYVLLILILIIKLKLINRKRQKMNKNAPSDNTTWLIIIMTITFLIAEASAAGLSFFGNYEEAIGGEYNLFGYIHYSTADGITRNLRVLNSASHAVICYFMSTQYRDTVHQMICCSCKRNKKEKVSVIQVTVSGERSTTEKTRAGRSY